MIIYDVTHIEKTARIGLQPTSRMGTATSGSFTKPSVVPFNMRETHAPISDSSARKQSLLDNNIAQREGGVNIEKPPVSADTQRLALGEATSDLSAEPSVMAIYPREARAPHQTAPQGSELNRDASPDDNIAQQNGNVKESKNSLAVPYRTPKGETVREYLRRVYGVRSEASGKTGSDISARPAADAEGELPPAATLTEELDRMAARNYGRGAQPKAGSDGWVTGLPYYPPQTGEAKTEGAAAQQDAGTSETQAQGDDGAKNGPALKASAKSLEIQKRATRSFVDKVADALSDYPFCDWRHAGPVDLRLVCSVYPFVGEDRGCVCK